MIEPAKTKTSPRGWKLIRNRIIAGLFVALPIFITYFVIKWLYDTLYTIVIGPISRTLLITWFPPKPKSNDAGVVIDEVFDPPAYFEYLLAPGAALGLVLAILFVAGMFFNSRLHRTVEWILNNIPGVNTVYAAVSNVFDAIQRSQSGADDFKRVVLVEFPHPGIKAPAFVTSECTDVESGDVILCVYVPTTPVPTSGYMLMVPEEQVVAVDWDLQETLQAIVSGGLTVPPTVQYNRTAKTLPSTDPAEPTGNHED